MCGILVTSGLEQPFHHRLLASLRRRGPDDIGFWMDSDIRMAHSRLAIIGLDQRSTEPLQDERHVLAFNGEIYNFLEIRRRLESEGVVLDGANDAAVLLHAWTRWGRKILRELTGFWAFVIYDKQERRLSLVRDQFGVKPLYYWRDGARFCVASMIRTLLELLPQTPELDYHALSEYVRYQFTFGDKTFLRGVKKVPPGHVVEISVETGEIRSTCYEDIFAPVAEPLQSPTSEWVEESRELLKECVLESTISDISFTTFCSGGLDSSLITRIAQPEVAYHCNYSDPECNETFFARQVVQGTPTRLFVVNAGEDFELVERLGNIVADFDDPTIGSVILPLEDLLAQVKRRYKVALTGTGADELFAGYVRYQLAMGECYQDSYKALYQRMQGVRGIPDRFELAHCKGDPSLYSFYDPTVQATFLGAFEEGRQDGDDLSAMLRFDRRYFLPGLLNIDDKMSGRHSLESRPSLLHQRFVRRVLQLDCRTMLTNRELKWVLRRIADPLLPAAVVARNDKMGFTTPVGDFVNKSAHLIREQLVASPFRELYNLHAMHFTAENKFSRETFGLLLLDLWLNRFARRPANSAPRKASAPRGAARAATP